MLPYTTSNFFVLSAIAVLLLFFVKKISTHHKYYQYTLLAISVSYAIFIFPKPHLLVGYIVYAYVAHHLFVQKIKSQNKLLGTLAIVLPMLAIKSSILMGIHGDTFRSLFSFAGLSYITFRTASVYIESSPGDKSLSPLKYANYLLFTPTLLIGPIDRFQRFNNDIKQGWNRVNLEFVLEGFQMILFGIMHKFILAEAVSRYWLNADLNISGITANINEMYAYWFFLYFDFAGYSAMAIGLGKIMGIDVPINFNKPFLARNPQDFWRRFHKSLGDWLNDYFFKPMYMFFSRKKNLKKHPLLRQNVSLFLTFLLMGFWNGFQIHFIVSGALFGLYSLLYNSYVYKCKKAQKDIIFRNLKKTTVTIISIFITFNIAAFSLYIFSGRLF